MKTFGWMLGLVCIVAVTILYAVPAGVRYYVENNYAGVTVKGDILLYPYGIIELRGVAINRPNIKGELSKVTVAFTKQVLIWGGYLDVVVDDSLKSGAKTPSNFTLEGMHLNVLVHKGEHQLHAKELRFNNQEVCFDTGDAKAFGLHAFLTMGCMDREHKTVSLDSLIVNVNLPFNVPKLDQGQEVTLKKLKADPGNKIVEFEEAKVGSVLDIHGNSTFKVTEDTLSVDISNVQVNHPWIATTPVVYPSLGLRVPKHVLKTRSGLIRVDVGPASIQVDPSTYQIEGSEDCNTWVQAFPQPVSEAILKAEGHFSGQLSFEVRTVPKPSFSIKNSCKFECSSELITSLKSGQFKYMAYGKDSSFSRVLGSQNKDWTPLFTLPPSIPKAFITLEDPGFESHHGIIPQALENSLKANLQLGRFFRGGSTISMQLVKNIWLERSKTLGRKAEEAILTIALESCLSKAEILELYLNAVEFGPNLYGIGPAAQHYFHKPAQQLEVDEAFYLASVLPHPRTASPPTPAVMAGIRKLMGTLASRGLISNEIIPPPDQDTAGWDAN